MSADANASVAEFDARVRLAVYERVIQSRRFPTLRELAAQVNSDEASVRAAFTRLHEGRTGIVADRDTGELIFAAPFSNIDTAFEVEVDGRRWASPCGWDAMGAIALLGGTGTVLHACQCCGESLDLRVAGFRLADENGWMNLVVPAKRFWDDIVFT